MPDSACRTSRFQIFAWPNVAIVVVGYSLIALFVAWATHEAVSSRALPEAILDIWSAAMIWVALTACIAMLVKTWPIPSLGYGGAVAIYGAVILGASWVVNGAFTTLHVAVGTIDPPFMLASVHTASLAHMPFNSAAAIALIAVFHWILGTQQLRRATAVSATPATENTRAKDNLVIAVGVRRFTVAVDSIEWIQGAGDYVLLHCASESHIHDDRLYTLERKLSAAGFIRVHRSALVNLHRVVAVIRPSHKELKLELASGRAVDVSRRRQRQVRRSVLPRQARRNQL